MPTNDILPFGTAPGANVTDQATWNGLAARTAGFSAGVASSAQINKALRQSTFIAAAVAQFIADNQAANVVDDGVIATVEVQLKAAISAVMQGLRGCQAFASSGTFTVPAGVTRIFYKAVGGGGGGGAGTAANSAAGGGGSGAYAEGSLGVTPGQNIVITVGTYGAQGTTGNGGNGGTTSIGGFVSCPGGFGSAGIAAAGIGAQGSGASIATGGNVNCPGSPGTQGVYGSSTAYFGGNGASSPFGGPQAGGTGYPGAAFGAYGAGGSGGANGNFGGNGSPGVAIIYW